MKTIIAALNEAKNVIEYHIENINEESCISSIDKESIKLLIKSLNVECQCDDYNGFDCGCGDRIRLISIALQELDKYNF